MIKISPNTRDDPVDEMISPVTIDLVIAPILASQKEQEEPSTKKIV